MTGYKIETRSVRAPEAAERLRLLAENMIWLVKNKKKLRKLYPNKYVAVDHEEVIGVSDDMEKLISELKSKYKNIDHIAIDYVSKKDIELILPNKPLWGYNENPRLARR